MGACRRGTGHERSAVSASSRDCSGHRPHGRGRTAHAMSTAMTSTSTAAPQIDAIDPRLVVVKQEPFNAEAPLAEQIGLLTPTPLHYVRTNFGIPHLSAQAWRLALDGEIERPYQVTYD